MQLCGFDVGLNHRFFLIAGTCSIEGLQMSLDVAGQLKEACTALGVPLIYKGSFDKANRSSGASQRGVGMDAGLKILDEVRRQLHLPILTDVHDESQVARHRLLAGQQVVAALGERHAHRVDVVVGVDQRQCKVGGRVTFGCRVGESINEEW